MARLGVALAWMKSRQPEREWGCVTLKLRNNGMMALLPVIIIKCALRYSQSPRVLRGDVKGWSNGLCGGFSFQSDERCFSSSFSFEFQQDSRLALLSKSMKKS